MANRIFDPEGFAWKPFGFIADILLLSLLWLVCSLPLFTLGASATALYDAVSHSFHFHEQEVFSRFLRTFKREFKLSTLAFLALGAVWAVCFFALRLFIGAVSASSLSFVAAVAGLFLMLLPTGVLCWAFPLLSRFGFDLKGLCTTAVKLSMAKLPSTLSMAMSAVLAVYLCLRFIVPVLFVPALLALFHAVFLERVFRQYMPETEE